MNRLLRLSLATLAIALAALSARAQSDTIRYVKTTGSFTADGRSWATAKNDLQDAINDLYDYLTENNLRSGSIYVGAGTYTPSQSTESHGGGLQYTSFKIYPGIHIYGGFAADETDPDANPYTQKVNDDGTSDYRYRPHNNLPNINVTQATTMPWNYQHVTKLSGSHNGEPTFTFDEKRGVYNATYPGNSYHVVWFATQGFIPVTHDEDQAMHALPIPADMPASVDGCTISGGYASNRSTTDRQHTAYGGGVYMVDNSTLSNCVVTKCMATMRGGGVYLDGGGIVDKCFVHTCQASGVGIVQGYGGGVCVDYDGQVRRSYITNNSARIGAGVALCHDPEGYPFASLDDWREANGGTPTGQIDPYHPCAVSCIISNNTSTAEGAGAYLYSGGTLNHVTVTRNECVGQDITYYNRRHGRAGGVYVLQGGQIHNSILWGNKCEANNDVQYAAYTVNSTDYLYPQIYYSAFANYEITDWAGTTKTNVYSLSNSNTNVNGDDANYPYFIGADGRGQSITTYGAGLGLEGQAMNEEGGIPRPMYWKVAGMSSIASKGVQVTQSLSGAGEAIFHAHTDTDLFGTNYSPVSTLGALAPRREIFGPAMIQNQEYAMYGSYAGDVGHGVPDGVLPDGDGVADVLIPTLFVDPSRNPGKMGFYIGIEDVGSSWDRPCKNINDAITYFHEHLKTDAQGHVVYDNNGDVRYVIDGQEYKYVQILVRGGGDDATTAGLNAYLGEDLRTASIRPTSNMRLYGGFGPQFTGTMAHTQATPRKQLETPTCVSADVINYGYENHSAHVFALINTRNVIIDGFRMEAGNANLEGHQSYAPIDPTTGEREQITYGGGLIVNNVSTDPAQRVDMTGNVMRNCLISNCSGPEAAAIYVNGQYTNPATGRPCRAELHMLNTVVRNNTVGNGTDDDVRENDPRGNAGVVVAHGNADIQIDHCDILNNCGYAMETTAVDGTVATEGTIRVRNSVIYANGVKDYESRSKVNPALSYHSETGSHANIDGDYIYIDWDAPVMNPPEHLYPVLCRKLGQDAKWATRRYDPQTMETIGELYFFDTEAEAQAFAAAGEGSWQTPSKMQYPLFINPSRNVGHSPIGDMAINGGLVNYMPMSTNPMVNNACDEAGNDSRLLWDFNNTPRTYGGDPDIGAIECTTLPAAGTVIYVTPNGGGKKDGSSWKNAIAGNTIYSLGGQAAGTDHIDLESNRIVDNEGNDVTTDDERYCGGYSRAWFASNNTGATSTTTVTNLWTTEVNVYDNGSRAGETETVSTDVPSTITVTQQTSQGTPVSGFTAGWNDDERYPYGELSGQSRSFWRSTGNHSPVPEWWQGNTFTVSQTQTDPYTGQTVTGILPAGTGNGQATGRGLVNSGTLIIQNDRTEHFVGGLQYAVERATAYNTLADDDANRIEGIDSVQVWVSNGKYTDYKGFIMRDKTTVLGSFPAVKGNILSTPGLAERQALMTTLADIPRSKVAQLYDPVDYETILQISDVNPRLDSVTINPEAVKYWDNDYARTESTDTRIHLYKNRLLTHHFTVGVDTVIATNEYLQYPDFDNNGVNVITNAGTTNVLDPATNIRHFTFGVPNGDLDCWHLTYPDRVNNVGSGKTRQENTRITYPDGTVVTNTTSKWVWIRDGSLTGVDFYQTMPQLPAGDYIIEVDLGGGYRNSWNSQDTRMYFRVTDSNGNDLATPTKIFTTSRNVAHHRVIPFTVPTTGDVKVGVQVGDGVLGTGPNGGDPVDTDIPVMGSNLNRREFWMSNLVLHQVTTAPIYVESSVDEVLTDRPVPTEEREPDETTTTTLYTVTKERTSLRRRVLQMPDVTNPVYGGGTYLGNPTNELQGFNDNDFLEHFERVIDPNRKANNVSNRKHNDPNYVRYHDVVWDGFTIRNGFIYDISHVHGGAGGVSMYEGASLRNCIVLDNFAAGFRMKGAGVFCDGASSTIEGCFMLRNTSTRSKANINQNQIFAGGLFLYEGTCFNSLMANNYAHGYGGGLGLCVGKFYNNTVAYNISGHPNGPTGGLRIATNANSSILMANTILYGNNGVAISMTETATFTPFIHCYIQSADEITNQGIVKALLSSEEISGGVGVNNTFFNHTPADAVTTPFIADVDDQGNYTGGALTAQDYQLRPIPNLAGCINMGTQQLGSVTLPSSDVVFADRIQDCQVDIGAYEYNAAYLIEPTIVDNTDGHDPNLEEKIYAFYYVSEDGAGGTASAKTPSDAACAMKLQKVLDAAGRYKMDIALMRKGQPKKYSYCDVDTTPDIVAVKLAEGTYYATRSTDPTVTAGYTDDNVLLHAFIIPHGVQLWGGYGYLNDNAPTEEQYYNDLFDDNNRNILKYKTILSGKTYDPLTGTNGEAYHVVYFTDDLFDGEEVRIVDNENGQEIVGQLANLPLVHGTDPQGDTHTDQDRAVIDGLFLTDSFSNGNEEDQMGGGAAIVTAFAHVRNCVIRDNEGREYGALYLKPGALVSGSIIDRNEAKYGAGIYVEEPTDEELAEWLELYPWATRNEAYARVYNTTVVYNHAGTRGGGLYFGSNLRAKGVVLWQNRSSDMNNVAGTFDSNLSQSENNYPFSYSAVQNRSMPGVNNLTIDGDVSKGVRWSLTAGAASDVRWRGEPAGNDLDRFYYLQVLSQLVRNGMPYSVYNTLRAQFPSLELRDVAGVRRMEYDRPDGVSNMTVSDALGYHYKENQFLEVGARALNKDMGLRVKPPIMHRLFVAKPEDIDVTVAEALMACEHDLYSQIGSSFANPFQRLTDALDYIVRVRNEREIVDEMRTTDYPEGRSMEAYKDVRFEIYVAGGEYYPYHNARGDEGHARAATFVIPEGVTLVGGLDPQGSRRNEGDTRPNHFYSQAGYDYDLEDHEYYLSYSPDHWDNELADVLALTGVQLQSATSEIICEERVQEDVNRNNVYEPWEFWRHTDLTGQTQHGGEQEDNTYHVISCFADPLHVGTLPTITREGGEETTESLRHRTIIFDGINVMHGNACDYEASAIRNAAMFYRGGGMLVDGSWTSAISDSEQSLPDDRGNRDIPVIISNSQFLNNNAVQGGAVFTNGTMGIYSCSFVGNFSEGWLPRSTQTAQEATTARLNIRYTGGGAVAANGDLLCVNSIFANNEAKPGAQVGIIETHPGEADAYESQRAFGGSIWGGANSNIRLLNCDVVKNKAASYPSVYNVTPNQLTNVRHSCINTVFWGNEADSIADIIHFPPSRDVEALFFCAYLADRGCPATSGSNAVGTPPNETMFDGNRNNILTNLNGYNNNVILSPINDDVDGPNFILPSANAGVDGYNPGANWIPSRVNRLTDSGWSFLKMTEQNGSVSFVTAPNGTPLENNAPDNVNSGGPFNWKAWDIKSRFGLTLMPLGNEYYMKYVDATMTDNDNRDMLRISSNPLAHSGNNAYIDIGVYEYQHRELKIFEGAEVDVLWVTDTENPEVGNDGYTWETPTSNLQAAIETLMRSRNGHAKQINIITGKYKPFMLLGEGTDYSLSFTIQTQFYNSGACTPNDNGEYGIKSLTIRGGYSRDIPGELGYDYEANPVVLEMEHRSGTNALTQLNHVFDIVDAEQYVTWIDLSGNTNSAATGKAIPLVFEGLTFSNQLAQGSDQTEGAAFYYHAQTKWDPNARQKGTTTLDACEGGEPKITIRNCIFRDNGLEGVTNPMSAVKIEGGGGKSLIVNSLFADNKGCPLDAVNTAVLNCSFANNGGHLTLMTNNEIADPTYTSELHNSVVWHDDNNANRATQFIVTDRSGVTLGTTASSAVTVNAITGLDITTETATRNTGLSDDNFDVLYGPNFADPDGGDYHIEPSMKLLNKGDNATYYSRRWTGVLTAALRDLKNLSAADKQTMLEVNGIDADAIPLNDPDFAETADNYLKIMMNEHPYQRTRTARVQVDAITDEWQEYEMWIVPTDNDLAFTDRLQGSSVDRGAYECVSQGRRILYVDPNKSTGDETGQTWQDAFSQGHLQRAIDAAAIFVANTNVSPAIVFVKGQNRFNSGAEDVITLRDGVHIYGGIQSNNNRQAAPIDPSTDVWEYTDDEVSAFAHQVASQRRGLAAKNASITRINGITTVDGNYTHGTVVDGVQIVNGATTDAPATTPAVDVNHGTNNVVRNSIISGNVMADGVPIVRMNKGLLYDLLCYDNEATNVIELGQDGYGLNNTIVGGTTALHAADASHVYNTITVGGNGQTLARTATTGTYDDAHMNTVTTMFAPYLQPGAMTPYASELPAFLTNHVPYYYQLHECTSLIDAGSDDGTTATGGLTALATLFPGAFDFTSDRDLLGNPRRIAGHVDIGCFETWRLNDGDVIHCTNVTNAKTDESLPVGVIPNRPLDGTAYTDNYGGNLYPHVGSVVYIGNGASLVIDTDANGDALFGSNDAIRPGYVLVHDGGSLYGSGNHIRLDYVAAERNFAAERYAMMSLPYDCDLQYTLTMQHNAATDVLTPVRYTDPMTIFTYDGEARSAWRYHFKRDDSDCWNQQADLLTTATEGWVMDAGSPLTRTLRFTAWGESDGDFVYIEDGNDKWVTLTQYDDRTSTGGTADFTTEENMGWNLKGLPWLVSDYATSPLVDGTYQMNVPHLFYTMGSNGEYERTPGQIYTARSWDADATLKLNNAFFTQTAIMGDTETLTFKTPIFVPSSPVINPIVAMRDEQGLGDVVRVTPDEQASATMPYQLGSDGVKWMAFDDRLPQLYLINASGTRFSLAGAAPVQVDIPLGITAPQPGTYTVWLPTPEAYEGCNGVYLIDTLTGATTDLMQGEAQVTINEAGDHSDRFLIRFGGAPTQPQPTEPELLPEQPEYIITTNHLEVTIEGLEGGEQLNVFNASGAHVVRATAQPDKHQLTLPSAGVYIVMVNRYAVKIVVKE